MNELLEQFAIESRELVSQATAGLLHLEHAPRDAEGLDAVFRAFHTLKGGAGIVEFPAMERALHAAEDLLAEARTGRREITARFVGECLASLDQIGQWLDMLVTTGELPQGSDAQAERLVRRFAAVDGGERALVSQATTPDEWLAGLRERHSNQDAITAVRYAPESDCFFQGEDPVVRLQTLPQLLALELVPVKPWPALSELDPYSCNLILMALSAAPAATLRSHLQGHSGTCEILEIHALPEAAAGELSGAARELLQSQLALLSHSSAEQFAGRVGSAGRVAANVLRAEHRDDDADTLVAATERSLSDRAAAPLQQALERLLAPPVTPQAPQIESAESRRAVPGGGTTLRIDAHRIDALVSLTGELTTAKNALGLATARARAEGSVLAPVLKEQFSHFERLIARLQASVLALRVLPLRSVLQRFPRVLRELSTTLGKPTQLEIEGDDTEADKAVVEILFEPLLHTLRNAIDHGVEEPRRRLEQGKPLVATIKIRAGRQADRVVIEVEDDGAGINVERIRKVALARRLVTEEELQVMAEPQIIDLIFAPGFSTAPMVTEMSGRGVGLDAVRTAIERIGGHVAIESHAGRGTCARFSLPFSVMMSEVLTVEAGGQSFGIPLEALVETLRVPQSMLSRMGAAPVLVHRQQTIPLVDLASEINATQGPWPDSSDVVVVLATVGNEVIALRVERLGERMEIILKPLEGLLLGMRGISGTTLLGDGRVLLVLDLKEMLA